MSSTYTYQCMKATCKYVETYGLSSASYKCPKCGSSMIKK